MPGDAWQLLMNLLEQQPQAFCPKAELEVLRIIVRVGLCNLLLCALALLVAGAALAGQLAAFVLGAAAVAILMRDLVRERR